MNNYSEQDLENLRKAGKILAKIYKKILPQIKPGMKYADIVDSVELLIIKSGAQPAFPPNLSVNTIAAHDTAGIIDNRTIPEDALVKLDFGVAIDGCLTDCARSVAFGNVPEKTIDASKAALDKAIAMAKPGVKVGDIGRAIQETIENDFGLKPIRNLTGHQVAKGTLHAGVSIPNIKNLGISSKKLEEGATYAIEPFATTGSAGVVEDAPRSQPLIFSLHNKQKTALGKKIQAKYQHRPFSARMAARLFESGNHMEKVLKTAYKEGWHSYPPLWEVTDGIVGQSEDMILITKDGCEIITLGAYEN